MTGVSSRGTQRAHFGGSDHPQEPANSLENGILYGIVCVHVRVCVQKKR